jgi:hypothetical protein
MPCKICCLPWFSEIYRLIIAYLADSYYSSEGLKEGLKQVFGEGITMLDYSYTAPAGLKIGIPVITAVGCDPYLFTNY